MPQSYAYKVRDKHGKTLTGSIDAESTALVANKLRQMGYVPIAIDKKASGGMKKEFKIPGTSGGSKIKVKEVSVFSRQFAVMINSGLTLLRSLQILAAQTDNKKLAAVIDSVRQDVESGSSLSQALARHPKQFNRLFVAMIRAGETGGVLDETLNQLAGTIEKQVELRGKIKSAMTYPAAVLGLVVMILTAMLVFIVPMFQGMYKTLGGTLPLPTKVLLLVSKIFVKWFPIIIIFDVAVIFALKKWVKTTKGRATWDALKLKIPVFGKLVHKTALARFSHTFAVLLRSGVPILEALEITSETVGNVVVARAIKDVQQGVKEGESIAKPLEGHAVFPPMIVQMMAVGEETGALDELLEKIAGFYDQEVEATVNALTSLLEPLLITVLGGAVGGMVISLYMPMFNIIKLIK
jgi:type IV pilus assembly protein PilC